MSTTFSAGQIGLAYDPATGQRASATAPGDVAMAWRYDGPLLTDTTWSGPVEVTLSHDHDLDFRVVGERIDGTAFIDRFYDADGLLLGSGPLLLERDPTHGAVVGSSAGVVRHDVTLDGFGEPTTVVYSANGDVLLRFDDERDRLGRLVGRDETRGSATLRFDYAYDDAGRLVEVRRDGVVRATYTWDENGNRTTVERDGVVEVSVVDEQDRLLRRGATTYAWDADGALVERADTSTGATTRFDDDTLGGLRGVELPDGRTISYVLDAKGRRIGKRVDGWRQCMERCWERYPP